MRTTVRQMQLDHAIGMLRELSLELRLLPVDISEEVEPVLSTALSGMSAVIAALTKESLPESPLQN